MAVNDSGNGFGRGAVKGCGLLCRTFGCGMGLATCARRVHGSVGGNRDRGGGNKEVDIVVTIQWSIQWWTWTKRMLTWA